MSKPEALDFAETFRQIQEPFEAAFDSHVSKTRRNTISLDPYTQVPLESYPELAERYRAHIKEWADKGIDISQVIKSVLLVDTATEANLPWYTTEISAGFAPWRDWNARWTAEERSHEEIMLRIMESRGIIDMSSEWLPVREQNMLAGIHPDTSNPADGIAYVATQELLTKIAHVNSARVMDESAAKNLHAVGADEGRHYRFYVAMLKALAEVNPDAALTGMRRQHEGSNFAMPGEQGIPGYRALSKDIAISGLFDLVTVIEAQRQTIVEAGLLSAEPSTDDGKQALDWANGVTEKTDAGWERRVKAMEIMRSRAMRHASGGELKPFILGHTVELVKHQYQPIAA